MTAKNRFRVSRRQLCRPSRYRRVCHSDERFYVRFWPIAEEPARPIPQRCLFPSWSLFASSSLLQKLGIGPGMVIYGPRVRERTVDSLKVLPSSGKPTQYVGARHIVSTLFDPGRYAS